MEALTLLRFIWAKINEKRGEILQTLIDKCFYYSTLEIREERC